MSKDQPVCSAVIIFLNAERFLTKAIDSVLAQTLVTWELLLVDDGSTDGSTAIAQCYARAHPDRIVYLDHPHHRNLGKSTSRNLGMHHARGRYMAFLDADDVWLPEKLQKQSRVLDHHPAAIMVYGPTLYWRSWSGTGRDDVSSVGLPARQLYDGPNLLLHFLRRPGIVPGICSLLARTEAVKGVGGFDESIQQMYEDQTLITKLCLHGPVYVDDAYWDRYRQHPESTSALAVQDGYYHPWRPNRARGEFLGWLEDYLKHRPGTEQLLKQTQSEKWIHEHPIVGTIIAAAGLLRERIRILRS